MDSRTLRNAAKTVLAQYLDFLGDDPETTIEVVIDPDRDRFLLVELGWQGERRIYGTMIHLNVIDCQIWIQHDGTETGVAHDLIALGVPSDCLVLGYKSPERRKIVQFASS